MASTNLIEVLAAMGLLLAGLGWLSHKIRLPPAVGYLAGGLAAGHYVTATLLPRDLLAGAADVGVLFLLFLIGLELDLKRLRETLATTAVAMPFDIGVPALILAGAVHLLAGWSVVQSVTLGLTLSVSSTLFGERITSAPRFPFEARKRALGILLSEDVAAAGLLAVLAVLAGGSGWLVPLTAMGRLVFLFVLVSAAALVVVPRLLDSVSRTHSHELLVILGGGLVVAFGALGGWSGSVQLGALMAGVAAAEAGSRFVIRNAMQSLRDLAIAVFFFASGLGVDASQIGLHLGLVLLVAGLFLLSKLIVHVPISLTAGLNLADSLRTGLALGTVGEFSLILAATAISRSIAHPLLETATVGAMLVLLVASPLLQLAVPRTAALAAMLPTGVRKRLQYVVRGVRSDAGDSIDAMRLGTSVRLLVANVVMLLGWLLLWATLEPPILQAYNPSGRSLVAPVMVLGVAFSVAVPLAAATYHRYRDMVCLLVGVGSGQRRSVKGRLVELWVASTAFLLMLPLAILIQRNLIPLLAGVALAGLLGAAFWRPMVRLHRSMETAVTRILGEEHEASTLLDRVMEEYPWGIRFSAISVPPGSPIANKTVKGARVHAATGAVVALLQRNRRETVNPGPDELLHVGDTLVLMGDAHQVARAETLIVAHGEALRMTAQSRLASVTEVTVKAGSSLVGQLLGLAGMRERTGALVMGVWPAGRSHPLPFRTDHSLIVGDRLILLGSGPQVARATLLAEGQEDESTVESLDAAGTQGS